MKKSTPTAQRQSPARLIVFIALGIAAVAAVLIGFWPDAHRQPTREERAPASADVRGVRDDALLTFLSPDGERRVSVTVEVAATEATRTKGLMGRTSMGELQGMLFLFPEEEMRSFWMVNTPLSLDIIFVSAEKRIVTIQRDTVPYSEESVPSTAPAQYVVELNAGFCDRHDIMEGDTIEWLETGS
jgi:uncharacterized membrane protein (UPF0127 family)